MKEKLLEYFDKELIITEIIGRANANSLKGTVDAILQEFRLSQATDKSQEDEKRIIETAARLLKQYIKGVTTPGMFYPEVDAVVDKHLEFLPQSLKLVLANLLAGKSRVKLASFKFIKFSKKLLTMNTACK